MTNEEIVKKMKDRSGKTVCLSFKYKENFRDFLTYLWINGYALNVDFPEYFLEHDHITFYGPLDGQRSTTIMYGDEIYENEIRLYYEDLANGEYTVSLL